MRRIALATPLALALAGCGVSVRISTKDVTSTSTATTSTTPSGQKTFSARGMAVHFSYPASFSAGTINSVGRKLEPDKRVTRAALEVGSSGYDLLIVTRYARITPAIDAGNIHRQKRFFDRGVSKVFAQKMVGTVTSIGGLPTLRYDDAPTPGVPVKATTRPVFVFFGRDEYELQCQWTSAERAPVLAACDQMLRTLHT